MWNNSKRFGLHENLSQWLRDLADYLDKENYPLIHPSEKPSKPKLKKSSYNKLLKLFKKNYNTKPTKPPKFPIYSGNFTKAINKWYIKYNLEPEFYKMNDVSGAKINNE